MHSVGVVELHVTVNSIKIPSVAQQCFYGEFMSLQQSNVPWSSCKVPETALKHKNVHLFMPFRRSDSLTKQIVIADKSLRSFSELVRVALKHFTRSDGINNETIRFKYFVCVCVCVYSCLSYPSWISHLFCTALYCHMWSVWLYLFRLVS